MERTPSSTERLTVREANIAYTVRQWLRHLGANQEKMSNIDNAAIIAKIRNSFSEVLHETEKGC